ncbi:UDP-3-O-acyl-N-acetylglucosamine deacetylase [Lichenifustis flavocetrariae]|uniref:UDP-3-O-acyl-N-acetylglucosamine deacetylase n=1 Tax=Lichenifustis flavocetrariae TaxID=2949735 RepID=A0AA41Z693_9HYPH|nr:UDP-3-O-acyl-N-acetylglucosamine deacetylase [Lichenifustis flavocetrariae]MCW6511110.1 UDP-3-O-acyl-N-acetylglucosamine deacetylase [Lichenifustis flavocetrariae]
MKLGRQTTLKKSVTVSGQGVHSNAPVSITLMPAPAHSGIAFRRTNLPGDMERVIEAKWNRVSTTELCTVLGDPSRGSVSTVEHLMASLSALGVDNIMIEIDGPEVPIMDGSAAAFVAAIDWAGIKVLRAPRRYIKILKPVRVDQGRSFSELLPAASGFHMDVSIDFPVPAIGAQSKMMDLTPARFRREISRARTFGLLRDVEKLWKLGFALGSSLDNSIAVDDTRVLNPEGLRSSDEFVCHKMLDAVGDLALAGAPIIGTYRAFCPGHKMNFLVLQAMFADRSSFQYVEAPARSEPFYGDFGLVPVPAFAAEAN